MKDLNSDMDLLRDTHSRSPLPVKEGKPLMEKRRRARINESLSRLKLLVLGEVRRKNSKIAKLDKADILEMTVDYVNKVTDTGRGGRQQYVDKYRAGFNSCADEVRMYLASRQDIDVELRTRVIDHLANFIQNLQWLKTAQASKSISLPDNLKENFPLSEKGFDPTGSTFKMSYPNMASQTNQKPVTTSYHCYAIPESPLFTAGSPIFPPSPPFSSVSRNSVNSGNVFVFPEARTAQRNDDLLPTHMWRPW